MYSVNISAQTIKQPESPLTNKRILILKVNFGSKYENKKNLCHACVNSNFVDNLLKYLRMLCLGRVFVPISSVCFFETLMKRNKHKYFSNLFAHKLYQSQTYFCHNRHIFCSPFQTKISNLQQTIRSVQLFESQQ